MVEMTERNISLAKKVDAVVSAKFVPIAIHGELYYERYDGSIYRIIPFPGREAFVEEYAENIEEAKLCHIEGGDLFYIDDYENEDDFIAAIIKSMNTYETEKYMKMGMFSNYKVNERVMVRYIGVDDPVSLRTGKVYDARVLKKCWLGIVDESGEEYAYPPQLFEIDLDSYFGKRVLIQLYNGQLFYGKVIDYLTAEEDESDCDSVIIRTENCNTLVQLYETDIQSIHLLESPYNCTKEAGQSGMIPCLVCAQYMFAYKDNYEICPYCNWENE